MIVTIFILYFFTRLIPYFFSSVPTGYDAGIYLYLFKIAPTIPDWLAGSYYSIIFYLLTPIVKIFSNPAPLLIPLQVVSSIFLFIALNWSIKTVTNRNQRFFTLFLFSISAIQFRMYWFYYVKNILALGFLLLFLGAFSRKKYLLACFFGIFIGLIHLPTFFIFNAICATDFFIHKNKTKIFLTFIVSFVITIAFNFSVFSMTILPYFKPFLEFNRIVQPFGKGDWGGTFYDLLTSLPLMLIYLFLPVIFFFKNKKQFKEFSMTPFFSGLLATSVIIFGQFFFYRRFIPVWDLFVIVAAGYSVKQIFSMKLFYGGLTILFILIYIFKTGMPLKTTNDILELQKSNIKKSYIISTSKEDSAWIMGYIDAKVIAWNFGGYNLLSDKQWSQLYSGNYQLLKVLPRPLYIYISNKESARFYDLIKSGLLTKISSQIYLIKN